MNATKKKVIAILLMIFAVFGSEWDISSIFPVPEPPAAKILNIETPSNETIDRVKVFSDLITDPDDRAKIAIFNYEFAQRILQYDITSQQVNDVYTIAGKSFFKSELVDKYDGLAEEIIKLLEEVVGTKNHSLTEEEKFNLNKYFMGVAWVLIHKR